MKYDSRQAIVLHPNQMLRAYILGRIGGIDDDCVFRRLIRDEVGIVVTRADPFWHTGMIRDAAWNGVDVVGM